MTLSDHVSVSSRFQRSIRIDTDIGDEGIIESFVCPHSSAEVLLGMANGYKNSGESAFTWTGPYGSGKSSLVVAMSALLGGDKKLRKLAEKSLNKNYANKILSGFRVTAGVGWEFIPVVGYKGSAEEALKRKLVDQFALGKRGSKKTTIDILTELSKTQEGGLFIIMDEMGKFLEAAADGDGDVYFFQQLAELAARSNGKIVLLGILHQSFAEYARRLTRDIRDEWSKIQGRFIDMPLNVAGEEVIDLIGRAIQSEAKPQKPSSSAKFVANHISNWRAASEDVLATGLNSCWPLHPVTAALLGPISRRRFGQNQRSVFGFLNSSEPYGFQEFLKTTEDMKTEYYPAQLWDYLKSNLEPSIMSSPDGHRWSLAVEALSRAEGYGGNQKTIEVVKSIALIDMFHERSGLVSEKDLLMHCVPGLKMKELNDILKRLAEWSILLYKKHKKAYSLYEGSDFDIDAAIDEAFEHVNSLDFNMLKKLSSFQPIVAKRHYSMTGALRWMDVDLVPLSQLKSAVEGYQPKHGAIGLYTIVLVDNDTTEAQVKKLCKAASSLGEDNPIAVSLAKHSDYIVSHAKELQALEWIKTYNPALGGDTVARREVDVRFATIRDQLIDYLTATLSDAEWYLDGNKPIHLNFMALHEQSSAFADKLYNKSPRINSELANRIKPSSNSNAAMKQLLNAMITRGAQPRLGIEGYPAEGGLYDTLLKNSGLHNGAEFLLPSAKNDKCNLKPMWQAADKFFEKNASVPVTLETLYGIWEKPPYGVKKGILPFFAVSYIMTRNNDFAVYLENVYRPSIDDYFIDILMKFPENIALRKAEFSDVGQKILAGVCRTLNELHPNDEKLTETSEPLVIARKLVGTVMGLPAWVMRTRHLSKRTIKLRELIKNANDPNKVLFDDLPHLYEEFQEGAEKGQVEFNIQALKESLLELVNAYPKLIADMEQELFGELQVNMDSELALEELHMRASNVMQASGDFKLDAFAARLSTFSGTDEDIEGIASLAADKPTRDWIDLDVNRAKLRIAELAQQFNHIEAFGRVNNREDFRQAVAFMVGLDDRPQTYVREFTVKNTEKENIEQLEAQLTNVLSVYMDQDPEIALAALANLGARIIEGNIDEEMKIKKVSA